MVLSNTVVVLLGYMLFLPASDVPAFNQYAPFPPPLASDVYDLPMLLSWYDWNLGDINCNDNCGWTSSGLPTSDDLFGEVAACPSGWTKHIDNGETTVVNVADMELLCVDNGGAVEVSYRDVYHVDCNCLIWQWVIVLDVAWDSRNGNPWWGWELFWDWGVGIGEYSEVLP